MKPELTTTIMRHWCHQSKFHEIDKRLKDGLGFPSTYFKERDNELFKQGQGHSSFFTNKELRVLLSQQYGDNYTIFHSSGGQYVSHEERHG